MRLLRQTVRPGRRPAGSRGLAPLCLVLALGAAHGLGGTAGAAELSTSDLETSPSLVGRPLDEALAALRAEGLKLIYTSSVVRPGMRVVAEPTAEEARARLEELLAPHGLEALDGPNEAIVIVPRMAPPVAPAAAPQRSSIIGTVRSHRDATAVAGVAVRLLGTDLAATSRADGGFLIRAVEPGSYTLEVTVDDDIWCRDMANDATRSEPITVLAEPPTTAVVRSGPGRGRPGCA